ncbi:MAG: hypothetical protein II036_04340, partial [Oscillospiraceae bacterium]|nr:hypothetical protein [Oscillospiraceae bacterium]
MIDDRDFLEYARYVDNYYGTPKIPVFEHLARGTDVILEIDTVGAFHSDAASHVVADMLHNLANKVLIVSPDLNGV